MRTVSAGDANRHFSHVLREVTAGEVITVLSRGKPVATISRARAGDDRRQAAKRCLLERLRQQEVSGVRDWTRNELYEE